MYSNRVVAVLVSTFTMLSVFALPTTAWSQNSSLFQRPVAYVARQTGNDVNGELLPPPAASAPNPSNGGSPTPYGGVFGSTPMGYPQTPNENANVLGLQTSWTFVPPVPTRTLKLHDIVSIRVEEATTSLAFGNATSRKATSYDAVLKEWVRLVGLDTVKPAPQVDGDPRVQATSNEVYRANSEMRTSESLTTNIAAEIVDIRPNGLVVLNATTTNIINDNTWRMTLTGTCRSQDIGPDNTVLSRHLIHKTINKQDQGHVRDGYSRGWLTKLVARIKPF